MFMIKNIIGLIIVLVMLYRFVKGFLINKI